MKDEEKANIKYRLSDIGKQVGDLALEYISDLEKENRILRNDIRVARDDRERLQLKVGKGLQEFIHDCPHSALKFYASEKMVEENARLSKMLEMAINEVLLCGKQMKVEHPSMIVWTEETFRAELEKRVENEK